MNTPHRMTLLRSRALLFLCAPFAAVSAAPVVARAQAPVKPSPKPAASGKTAAKAPAKAVVAPAAKASPERLAKLAVKIKLTDGKTTVARTRREMGFSLASPSGPVAFTVDKGALKNALARVAKAFNTEAQNARPYVQGGQVRIKNGAFARHLNVSTTAEKIAQTIAKDPAAVAFNVAVDKKPPVLTAERLKGINGVLASFTTQTSGVAKRNTNIDVAVGFIDGALLSPGETFSLNKTVGERTQARGFRTAHVFVEGKIVDGIGGGVSQVTGTLFNAAALAGLSIKEVNPHSRPVAYLPLGRDATVAYGDKDLKFANNTKAPVFIAYTFADQTLTATLYGAKTPGRRVSLRPRVQRVRPGLIRAQLYRVTRTGDAVSKERLLSHTYKWDPDAK